MKTKSTLKVFFALFITAPFYVSISHAQVPQYVKPDGLRAWYAFSNGSTEDGTNNNQDLQNLGCTPAPDRFGTANNAYNFDGIATYMRRNNFQFPWSESSSVSAWFRRSAYTITSTITSMADSYAQPGTWRVRTSGVQLVRAQSYLYGGAQITISGAAEGEDDWHHVVFVRNENDGASLYVNGELKIESELSELMEGFVDLYIGASAGPVEHFEGQLDDIGIWATALTACDVKKLFLAYQHTQPQSISVGEGSTANFSITNNNNVNYQWQVNSGTGWQDLSNFGQYTGVNSNTLSVLNVGLNNNNFAFQCIIDYGDGCTEETEVVILTVTPTSGIFDSPNIQPIGIFPNPNSGQFQLDLQNTEFTPKASITVFDNTGKSVYSSLAIGLQPTIDLTELPNGIYLVRVSENDLVGTSRISVVK